jgi:hypothetical protein
MLFKKWKGDKIGGRRQEAGGRREEGSGFEDWLWEGVDGEYERYY